MKFYIVALVVLLFFVHGLAHAQGVVTLINKSDDFFQFLDQGKFEDARAIFDESVSEKITGDILKSFWTSITEQLGVFESIDDASSKIQGEYYLVILNCKFSKASQAFQLAYNKKERLIGFVILPNTPESAYINPPYADTALYKEEFITVKSTGHDLAGMLTKPVGKTNFPVVVLVHGSGPQDMDETIGPNKPFKDLAAGLAAKGIATLRYVKRTRVYANEFNKAYTLKEEVVDDALAAIAFARAVPEGDKKQLYLFGHSLGGMLAPRIAALAPDLNGIIMAAAPAVKFTDILIEQNKYFFGLSNDTTAATKKHFEEQLKALELTRLTKLGAIKPDSLILGIPAAYWIDINVYDQLASAKRLKNRMLILQGQHDFQVSAKDLDIWRNSLAGNKNVAFKLFPVNHLLAEQTEKGSMEQYQKPGNVAAKVIDEIASWILSK